jgi:CheY-like chemotaxis protein
MPELYALIIDDDTNNLEVMEQLLTSLGVRSVTLKDPSKAIQTIETMDHLDVVFADLEMPKVDGYQLLAQLRQVLGRSVPIVCSTVHLAEIDTARRMGFDAFLGKPLDGERFPQLLERILNGESVWELP